MSNAWILTYNCLEYRGYTSKPTRIEVLQCYFAIIYEKYSFFYFILDVLYNFNVKILKIILKKYYCNTFLE